MARYLYIAKNRNGESEKGVMEARDEHELAGILREEGCILIKAELESQKIKRKFPVHFLFFGRVSLVEKTMFTRNLKVMVASGIPLPRALDILIAQSKSKKFKKVILKIKEDVIKGLAFSDAVAKHPSIFPEVFSNMVKVGEESGTLEDVLEVLTKQMEKEHEIKSRVKGAMIYPAVILVAMFGIGTLMLILVVPKLSKLFDDLKIELPLSTKVIVAIGNFLSAYWYAIPVVVVALVFLVRIILKTKIGKRGFDAMILKIPIISPIIRKMYSARTIRTLSSLISSGVPIVRSLEIVSGSLENIYYKEAIKKSSEKVRKGSKLSEALEPYDNIYPTLVIQMIAVGEETGETSSILAKLADFFEQEVNEATKNLSAVIEPILMLIIGAAVGFFAISMIQPMYSMMEGV
ncbi:type II secretion system F family protein [Patescibacteria group bacterium]|nr:type II secretion system F family protein [Patescibacteria group bacterium]